jgi:transposase
MKQRGCKVAEIARVQGVSRQTVYRWLSRDGTRGRSRVSKLEPYKEYVRSRLRDYCIPAPVLLRELRGLGYTGGITILKEHAATVREEYVARVVQRFETEPGRQAQADWGECGGIEHRGERKPLFLFAVVLGYSRYMWAEFTTSSRRPELLRLLEKSFSDLGGVPSEVLLDNMKQAVDHPREKSAPAVVNDDFKGFSAWWGFEPLVCPPYWPQAKGKIERGVGYIKKSFLEGLSFTDLDDLNGQLRVWLATVANVRDHGTTRKRPVDLLPQDQAVMGALQMRSYPTSLPVRRLADHDGTISWKGVRYSVDPRALTRRRGTPVDVFEGVDGILRIYKDSVLKDSVLVGQHRRVPAGSPPQMDMAHAAICRELAAKPGYSRPRGRTPRFRQYEVPAVQERPLSVYEEVCLAGVAGM